MNRSLLDKIQTVPFPRDQYFPEPQKKGIVVIHHTAGWDNARGMFDIWKNDRSRVATCIGIQDNGKILQGFHSSNWGYHIGAGIKRIEQISIGVEICNWGPLALIDGKYYSWAGAEVEAAKVVTYKKPFRKLPKSKFFDKHKQSGKPAHHYERYTDAEIKSLKDLLLLWNKSYGIPLDYHEDMWDLSAVALAGAPGIWTHVSYRADKTDCHPQPELIKMLQSLSHDKEKV